MQIQAQTKRHFETEFIFIFLGVTLNISTVKRKTILLVYPSQDTPTKNLIYAFFIELYSGVTVGLNDPEWDF